MKNLQQIALADLENDKLYLLALSDVGYCVPEVLTATGAEIKEFVLAENEYLFEDDEDLTIEEKLSIIEEDVETEVVPTAFILP